MKKKSWLSKVMITLAILCFLLGITGFIMLQYINFMPQPVMPAQTFCKKGTPTFSKKQKKLRVLSWNIQYGASRNYHFFYNGGKDVIVAQKHVNETLRQIAEVIRKQNPDVILWQELDAHSKRTNFTQQLDVLWNALSYGCRSDTTYHRSKFVPTPSFSNAMGAVDMRLAIFSKYKLTQGTRYALPMLKENYIRRAFNLKRAVHEVHMPFAEGGQIGFLNTHFSAFSHGDGTMMKQTKKLIQLIEQNEKKGNSWIAGGDLNLLAPGIDRSKIVGADTYYPEKENPLKLLFKRYKSALSLEKYNQDPKKYNTYLPPSYKQADRWIDHIFHSKDLRVETYFVAPMPLMTSDHLPIVIDFAIQ